MMSGIGNAGGVNPQMMAQMREQMFRKADANGDGSFTKEEFSAAAPKRGNGLDAAQMFQRIDNNSDGKLDQSELDGFGQKMAQAFLGGGASLSASNGDDDPVTKLLNELQQAFRKENSATSDRDSMMKKLQQTVQDIIGKFQEAAPYGKDGTQEISAESALLSLQV